MKKTVLLATALAGVATLAACHGGTTTTNTVVTTDNVDSANMLSDGGVGNVLDQANATIANGENMAADLTTHDHDTNLANGI